MVLICLVVKKSQKYFKAQQEYLGHVNGQVEEVYGGHNIMKAFNGEEKAIKEFNELNDTLYDSCMEVSILIRNDDAYNDFCRKLRICISFYIGWMA